MTRQLSSAKTIRQAAQMIDAVETEQARAYGITTRQIDIILALADTPGLSQVQIMERCTMDRSTLSTVIRNLVKEGYVRHKRRREDSRAYSTSLTAKGEELVEDARRIRNGVESRVDSIVNGSALSKLRSVIAALEAA